jgi:hypothetical protein
MFVRAAIALYVVILATIVFIPAALAVTVNKNGSATITKSEMAHCKADGGCLILTAKQWAQIQAEIAKLKSHLGKCEI